ncbi:TauD/TfdA dioxygenase family protein [Actinokineospora sp.]|uniref:TauD/TfdA dioxygenase family protein n=1 Tax=Actinokineospora sp. TaxID=1872133 RepID=UPI003D6A34A7
MTTELVIHPVVRVRLETGERALFVSPGSTTRIMELSQVESRRVLDLLFEHLTSAEHTVRFRWEPGSIAFWDNRSTCHFAPTDFAHYDNERVMHRVTILGDVPVGVDGSVSELVGAGGKRCRGRAARARCVSAHRGARGVLGPGPRAPGSPSRTAQGRQRGSRLPPSPAAPGHARPAGRRPPTV